MQLADRVTAIQTARRADIAESGSESNNLNFGLCEVVYEWAKGRVSARYGRLEVLYAHAKALFSALIALQRNRAIDGRSGRYDSQEHNAARRDMQRSQRRSQSDR